MSEYRIFCRSKGGDISYGLFRTDGRGSKTCCIELDIAAPSGWYVVVSSNASFAGSYSGNTVVTLEQALVGDNGTPEIEYLDGSGSYLMQRPNYTVGAAACGAHSRFKTMVSLTNFFRLGI